MGSGEELRNGETWHTSFIQEAKGSTNSDEPCGYNVLLTGHGEDTTEPVSSSTKKPITQYNQKEKKKKKRKNHTWKTIYKQMIHIPQNAKAIKPEKFPVMRSLRRTHDKKINK